MLTIKLKMDKLILLKDKLEEELLISPHNIDLLKEHWMYKIWEYQII